jgi:hypothetical protein
MGLLQQCSILYTKYIKSKNNNTQMAAKRGPNKKKTDEIEEAVVEQAEAVQMPLFDKPVAPETFDLAFRGTDGGEPSIIRMKNGDIHKVAGILYDILSSKGVVCELISPPNQGQGQ